MASMNSGSMPENEKKTSKGRQKIEIKMVEAHNKRHVTFSKRKHGIFNKAAELSVLTGAEIAVMAFSRHGKAFAFGSPGFEAVVQKYLGQGCTADNHDYSLSSSVTCHASKVQYLAAMKLLEVETRCGDQKMSKQKSKEVEEAASSCSGNGNNGGFWWDCPIESMDLEELKQWLVSLQELKDMVEKKAAGQIITKPS
ncbi:agamous-like MADS-box protein AGL61 [Ziziphus jujuba]|nr:agamous-like MADS-box protein AGL61 [Ziziphus jujuba]